MINVLPATYGIRWLDGIPAHWQITRSKRLFTQRKEKARASDQQLTASQEFGVIPQAHFMEKAGRQVVQVFLNPEILNHVEEGDFVISMRSFQGGLEVAKATGCISSAYVVLKPSKIVHRGFFSYLLKSARYIQALQSTSNLVRDGQALRFENFAMVDLPLLPLKEQQAIANFLDRKTAAIDALIEKQQKLVELLAEKRAALINQAVTKGLDPNVPMKESGIPGIGEVPAHWQVMALRRVLGLIEQGWSPQCEGHPVSGNDWGVLKSGCTAGGCFNENANKTLPTSLEPRLQLLVREGDVLVCRASGSPDIIGSAALVPTMEKRLMLSDKIFRLNFVNLVHPAFVVHALASRASRSQIENMISGAEGLANNLPQARLKDLMFARPPYRDQIAIAQWLESELERLDNVRAVIAGQLSRLQEYRQALITAAVTGQLEIPEARQ